MVFSWSRWVRSLSHTSIASMLLGFAMFASALPTFAQLVKPAPEDFFSYPEFSEVTMSPEGDFVAFLAPGKDGRMKLGVMKLADKTIAVAAGASDADISDIRWVNNKRLVYSSRDSQAAAGDGPYWPGLFAVNRDGTELFCLIQHFDGNWYGTAPLPLSAQFFDVDHSQTTDNIFVALPGHITTLGAKSVSLERVNSKNGDRYEYERPGQTYKWVIDQNGTPRINVTEKDGINQVYYRDPANDKWRKLAEFPVYGTDSFDPVYFDASGALYVLARAGRDTSALYRYNLESNKLDADPMIAIKGYDFHGSLILDESRKKLLGVNYETDAWSTLWFDEDRKKLQQVIDALLPGTINMLSTGQGEHPRYALVRSYSDVQPLIYTIYDSTTGKLEMLGSSHPKIDPKQMSQQEMIHYVARDGLEIPAYLTLPKGGEKKNLPLIVLVHGGPWLRGSSWEWDADVQFLASRGYAVLQPEFRGGTGFGLKHFQAGWKQYGFAMQDDLADGAKWAIAQGVADSGRICIFGGSYGGYASLMGLAKNPDIFRCGIDWSGYTDLDLMFQPDWNNDLSEEWKQYGIPVLIGDRVKDAEKLKEASPVNLASRIKQPVLLAYGGTDYRVPIQHGEKFRDAIRPYNDKVEWLYYWNEGHGWRLTKTNVDFWTHVEKFLDSNIGKPH